MLRRLEALLVVADADHVFLLSGSGELIEPDDGVIAVGSGGGYALAAARALLPDPPVSPREMWWSGRSRSRPTSAFSPIATSRFWNS